MKIKHSNLSWNDAIRKKNEWDQLLINSDFPNPFTSLPFYNAWVDTFVDDHKKINVIFFYDDEILIGIAPLIIDDDSKSISILGDKDLFDYRDIIVNPNYSKDIYELLFFDIFDSDMYQSYKFILESIPENSNFIKYLKKLNSDRFKINVDQEDVTPNIELSNSWEDYLMLLNKKQRHEVRRKLRKFEAEEFTNQLITDQNQLDEFLDDFFELFVKSREDKEEFLTSKRKIFFKKLLFNFADVSQLRILSLYDDGKLISGCIVIDYDETYFLYNNAYSLLYNSFSVGLVSKIYAIKESLERDKKNFNFLRGDERYKYHLGGKDIVIYTSEVQKV
jgi:hypothetical protein